MSTIEENSIKNVAQVAAPSDATQGIAPSDAAHQNAQDDAQRITAQGSNAHRNAPDWDALAARRATTIPANVFAAMDAKVAAAQATGHDVIDLSKANPDLRTPEFIVRAGQEALDRLENHRYSHFDGKPAFRRAAADWYLREHGVHLDPDTQVMASIGAVLGLTAVTQALLDPGDVLAVPDPYYPPYAAMASVAGAELLPIPTSWEAGFLPDFDAVPAEQWRRVKLLLLNYPNNPTGATATRELFEKAIELAHRYGFVVANDFAYTSLDTGLEPQGKPLSLLAVAGAEDVAVEVVSMSKMYGMAGWRLGFVAGPEGLMRYVREYHHQMASHPTGAVQDAGQVALESDQSCVDAFSERYRARRAQLGAGLAANGFDVFDSHGSLFVWARVPSHPDAARVDAGAAAVGAAAASGVAEASADGAASNAGMPVGAAAASANATAAKPVDSAAFAERLLEEANVAVMPGSCFGAAGEGYVRLSLLADEDRLAEAVRRIGRVEQWI